MKRVSTMKITIIALAAVINIIGGQLALVLKLPIYLDTIGTLFTAAILGPVYGIFPGLISGVITGVTVDVFSFYFLPVQIITGIMAGLVFQTKWVQKWRLAMGTLVMTIPGTFIGAVISAFLFGGFTSSGSSVIVALLRKIGFHEIASVFMVQIATDYLDRILSVVLVIVLVKALPKGTIAKLKGNNKSLKSLN